MSDRFAEPPSGTAAEGSPAEAADSEASTLLLENDLLQQELKKVRQEREEAARESELAKDLARRTQADLANIRRRVEKERREHRARAVEDVCLSFLPVLDDLARAAVEAQRAAVEAEPAGEAAADPAAGVKALSVGVALVLRRFRDTLTGHGIEEIEAEGAPFDPRLHEALLRVPAAPGERDEQITRVFERGFRRGARVIRHAKVQVADGTAPEPPGEADDPAAASPGGGGRDRTSED